MKRLKLPRPTDSELDILRVLWNRGPSTVRDVFDDLNRVKPTGYTTALKMLQIMTGKGLVDRDDGRLVQNYSLATDVHERVRRPEVDREIIGEHPGQKVVEHHRSIARRLNPRVGVLTVAQSVPP